MVKFIGEFEDLRELVAQTGIPGTWRVLPNGHIQFCGSCGAFLNWWPTTGTITFQGQPSAVDKLMFSLAALVIERGDPCTAQPVLAGPRRTNRRHLLALPAGRPTSPSKP